MLYYDYFVLLHHDVGKTEAIQNGGGLFTGSGELYSYAIHEAAFSHSTISL